VYNPYLSNYGKNDYFWTFFLKIIKVSTLSAAKILKKFFKKNEKKCAYQAFIIQNLDVVALELGTKVQFANF
jgi:hypothetical protein